MAKSRSRTVSATKEPVDKAVQEKRRELLELRIRCKIIDELARQFTNERKQIRAQIEALMKGSVPGEVEVEGD